MDEKLYPSLSFDLSWFLPEKFNLLADILANADIFLGFESLFEYIQYGLFSDIEPFPGDPSHLLQMHYKR
jgi:hypothetical protein